MVLVPEVEAVVVEAMAGKKLYRIIICFLLCLFSIRFPIIEANEEAGYVYDELNVIVTINEEKEYHVEEHMVIDFQKEMHGIIRDIPKESQVEDVGIKDVKVEGMPYHIQQSSDLMQVTIGDREQLVKGKKEIVLSYTLTHYQDDDPLYDDAYINVLGDNYDTEVKKFHAQISFPKEEQLKEFHVTSGKRGSTSNPYTTATTSGNQLIIDASQKLDAQMGITAHLRFQEATFSKAPVYPYPFTIQQMKTEVKVDEAQDFNVTQTFTYESIIDHQTYRMPLIHQEWKNNMYSIKDLSVEGGKYSDFINQIDLYLEKGTHTITIRYQVHPYHLMKNAQTLTMNDQDMHTRIDEYICVLDMPYIPDISMRIQHNGSGNKADMIQKEEKDGTLILTTTQPLKNNDLYTVLVPMNTTYFHRDTFTSNIGLYLAIPLLIGMIILRFICKTRNLITPINFHPPVGLNSAQAGYVIDMKLSEKDITSLIFYWADRGYIKIYQTKDSYAFEKVKDIDAQALPYEQKLFQRMFSHGHDGYVKKEDLTYHFYDDIMNANDEIIKYYQGKYALRDPKIEVVRKLCICLSFVPLIIYLFFKIYDVYGDISKVIQTLIPFMVILPLLLSFYLLSRRAKKNHKPLHRRFFFALFIFMIVLLIWSLAVEINMMLLIMCLATLILWFIANGIHKDSTYRKQLLSSLLGFKEFIETAQKDQLEMMLQEDPAYYYHVLPYAQVLHVSDIWMDKFKDLALPKPDWYEGTQAFHYMAIAHIVQNMEYDMKKTMHSSSTGVTSGSSGFHGGSVGGGSGGGGSHGW